MGPGSPLWLLVAASLLLAVGFLLYCVSNRDRRGATPLSVLLAGVSLWLAGDLLQPVLAGPTRFGAGIVFLGAPISSPSGGCRSRSSTPAASGDSRVERSGCLH